MILQTAVLDIAQGQEANFERTFFEDASPIIAQAQGFIACHLQRCIESPGRYLLQVQWRTLEDHTIHFRGAQAHIRWKQLLDPFYVQPPASQHYVAVSGNGPSH